MLKRYNRDTKKIFKKNTRDIKKIPHRYHRDIKKNTTWIFKKNIKKIPQRHHRGTTYITIETQPKLSSNYNDIKKSPYPSVPAKPFIIYSKVSL